ncbi:hypothetical protein CC99x_003395 [Candidatus Berkiella cookevillensis]|uniref:Uncharacterized protein n=1 Tax=Candidatus Berkiella cookevillensis TaxID=437022 RepID=A0A0Q9YD56_9GAMM|nr:hypothetical protein [Candidatus Berkiella cookevillensis]MCS5707942.1 hypothetical protein [Candidatus Berkiella cookevillensis]
MPDSTVFVFTYGNKGRGAFLITNDKGDHLCEITDIPNDDNECEPFEADWESAIKALEFIDKNRSSLNVEGKLNIKIFTTFEQVYRTTSGITKEVQPDIQEKFLNRFDSLRTTLQSKNIIGKQHNKLMSFWVPKEFYNKMDEVISHVKRSKPRP